MRRRLFPLLAGALADPRSFPGVGPAELDRLVALADYHRVTGQLAAAFADRGDVPSPVTQARQVATVRYLQTLEALGRAAGALDGAGIGWVVLKGPVLATRWYRDPAARSYQDLDLLVDPAGLSAAVDALAGVGFAERNRNWAGLRSVGAGEIALVDDRVMIDLHWHVVALERDRRPLRVPDGRPAGAPPTAATRVGAGVRPGRRRHARPRRAPRAVERRPSAPAPARRPSGRGRCGLAHGGPAAG